MVNSVRTNDTTIETDSSGQVTHMASWATPGYLTYYASFPDDSSYGASYSSPLTMYVSERTQVALAAWGVVPTSN